MLRETVTAKSMAFAFSAVYILLKYVLDAWDEYSEYYESGSA